MKFLVLLLFIGCLELINADCIIDELDIVVTINQQPQSVCSFRNENFHEGRSVRECNIDCTCMVGRLTCCSKSKTHCQRTESCKKVVFDFNTSVFTRSSVICEEKEKTKLVPVYDHISKELVKGQVVTIPPPQQVELTTPANIVEPPPENRAQRTRRLNIERIMRINKARRRNIARAQRRKASARSASIQKSSSTSENVKSSQEGMSLMDRLRANRARRRQNVRGASAQVDTKRAASESAESGRLSESKEEKQTSGGLTFAEMLKKNHERRLRKLRKQQSGGKADVQSKTAVATKQASRALTFAEMLKKNHERRLRKFRKQQSKRTAAVQSKTAAATKEKKQASESLTVEDMLSRNRGTMLNTRRSSYLFNAMRKNRMRRERRQRLRQQRLAKVT